VPVRLLEWPARRRSRSSNGCSVWQRFLSPQLAKAIVSSGDESILSSQRRQVAMAPVTRRWRKRGYDLDFGAGIALGYAT
jgi:hypothetical protein